MTDKEILISDLNDISEILNNNGYGGWCATIRKAVSLLKEQEPVEPELEGGGSTWWHVCGECHGAIDASDRYCKHCGRRIKHEKKAE